MLICDSRSPVASSSHCQRVCEFKLLSDLICKRAWGFLGGRASGARSTNALVKPEKLLALSDHCAASLGFSLYSPCCT